MDTNSAQAQSTADTTSDTIHNGIPMPEQVSFIITHNVKPDHHDDYETWLRKIIDTAARHKGHLGAHVIRPARGNNYYEIAVRFASLKDAENWIHSETRHKLVADVREHIQEPEKLHIKSGIDYWFTAATEGHEPPPRWKQWLLTVSSVWPLSMLLPWLLGYLFKLVPALDVFGVRHLIQGMLLVFLLTYIIMPRYTRAVSGWLNRKKKTEL